MSPSIRIFGRRSSGSLETLFQVKLHYIRVGMMSVAYTIGNPPSKLTLGVLIVESLDIAILTIL